MGRIVIAAMAGLLLGGGALAMGDPPVPAQPPANGDVAPSGPPSPAVAARSCVVFENENYGGRRLDARDGAALEWVGRAWNDRISSVACASGCRLIAYQTIIFGGARANFTGAQAALGPVWNDRISALRVACDGDHAAADSH